MTPQVRVFVNERPVDVEAGAPLAEAVAAFDADLAAALADGRAYVTDGVGRAMEPTVPVTAGTIVRVVRSVPRPGNSA